MPLRPPAETQIFMVVFILKFLLLSLSIIVTFTEDGGESTMQKRHLFPSVFFVSVSVWILVYRVLKLTHHDKRKPLLARDAS